MKNREKKEWIIRYIKRNNIDDILAEKHKNKKNVLKRYSNEIQSICSIISVLVIGIVSLIVSLQNNSLVKKQTDIMRYEKKPIIDIRYEDKQEFTDKLLVINEGTKAINYKVEIFAYINVLCNENNMGSVPIRVYFLDGVKNLEYRNTDKIAEITLYKEAYPNISNLENNMHDIISGYTNLYWDFSFEYLIKITSTDIMNEKNIDYFIYSRQGVNRVGNEYGNSIVDEYNYTIDDKYGVKTSKESFFEVEKNSEKEIFKYILNKIRDKNLYEIDFITNKKTLYGEYEPPNK